MKYDGIIWGSFKIIFAIYMFLLAVGILPKKEKNTVQMQMWRQKFGWLFWFISPAMLYFGTIQIIKSY